MGYIGNSNPSVTNLGGDIDVNGHSIKSSNNGNIAITPNGSGIVVIDGLNYPTSDGSNGQVLTTNGSGTLSFSTVSTGTITFSGDTITGSGTTVTIDDDLVIPDKITHSGDTNTHIRFPSADTISFETGGSERLRIASSGQIGLGGTNYGSSGQVLTSNGSGSAPTWQTASGLAGNATGTINMNGYEINFGDTTGTSPSSAYLTFGSGKDLQIFHSTTNNINFIKNTNARDLKIIDDGSTEMAHFVRHGTVRLRYNGTNCFETVSGGGIKIGNSYTLPASDGTNGQVLTTNGSGTLSFATASGGGGSSSSKFTVTVASAPSNPSSGEAIIYSTQTSGGTGVAIRSSDTSEVFKVYYHTNNTPRLYLNNSGNAEFYGYVGATYYNPRSGSTGGNFQPMAGYGEGSGLELPGAIIMTGSSTYSQYGKPIKMYGGSNAYISVRASTSISANTNFDFILPPSVGSAGQYLKTTGSGVTEWASVSASTPNPVDIPDSSSDQPTSNCIRVGTGHDMRIFHYNGKNYIRIATGGSFGGGGDFMIQDSYGQAMIDCIAQGHVKLTHNGSNKLTTAYGGSNSITLSGVYTLPGSDGSSGQQLTTNGSGTVTFAAASSDQRLKKNVSANDMGLSFINELDTKVYTFKSYKELDASDSQLAHLKPQEYTKDGDDSTPDSVKNETEDDIPYNLTTRKGEQRGLIAQEVKASLDKLGIKNFKGWGEDKHGVQEIHLEEFVVPLIKAVQELSKRVEELEKG